MRSGSMNRRLLLLASTALVLCLGSCGGGGSDDGGGAGSAGGTAGALTLEQRNVATARLAEQFEKIVGPATATPEQWEALRAWVLAQPEFVDAGVGDQTLWARFTDGRYFLYTDNWKPLPAEQARALQKALPPAQILQAAVNQIPASPDALLLTLLHEDFSMAPAAMGHMAAALDARGWTVGGKHTLTIDSLRASGELGFLFLTAHSGVIGPSAAQEFAVITEDQSTSDNEDRFAAELEEGTIIYNRDRHFWQRFGARGLPHYAITSRFVTKYLKFSPESLVILVACHTGSPEGAGFRDALVAKGAGTIIGWDGPANPLAYHAMDLMVDRLTGMNVVDAVTPPNRAFRMDEVWDYLDKKGQLITPSVEVGKPDTPVKSFGTGFVMANPILMELQAVGADKLVLHGIFGTDPATVSIEGTVLPATTSPDGTMVDVNIGPDIAGQVVVTTRKRKSNPRMLASWRGQVKYVQKADDAGCPPLFSNTVLVDLHLRADAHGVREEVDGPVRNNRWPNMPASDTRATWSADGTCVMDGTLQARWSGSGSVPLLLYDFRDVPASLMDADVIVARIDAVENRMQLALATGPTRRATVTTPDGTSTQPLLFNTDSMGFLGDEQNNFQDRMPWGTFLPFDAGLAVPARQQQMASPSFPEQTLTIDWRLSVAPAYDDTIGR